MCKNVLGKMAVRENEEAAIGGWENHQTVMSFWPQVKKEEMLCRSVSYYRVFLRKVWQGSWGVLVAEFSGRGVLHLLSKELPWCSCLTQSLARRSLWKSWTWCKCGDGFQSAASRWDSGSISFCSREVRSCGHHSCVFIFIVQIIV